MLNPASPLGVFLMGLASASAFSLCAWACRRFRQLDPTSPLKITTTAVGVVVIVVPALLYLHYATVRL